MHEQMEAAVGGAPLDPSFWFSAPQKAYDTPAGPPPFLSLACLSGHPKFRSRCQNLFDIYFFINLISIPITVAVNVLDEGGETGATAGEDIPYYINHYLLALSLFESLCLLHNVACKIFDAPPAIFAGYLSSLIFYISRDIRDHEKLYFW